MLILTLRKTLLYFQERRLLSSFQAFKRLDEAFLKQYKRQNPYQICREFFEKRGDSDPYVYGETPLAIFYEIAKAVSLKEEDHFLDLGAGRGRGLFFLSCAFGNPSTGIEIVPEFVRMGNRIANDLDLDKKVLFLRRDLDEAALPSASVVYLAGTCMEDVLIEKLAQKLFLLPRLRAVITVSFPLSDYHDGFKTTHQVCGKFLWGKSMLYISEKHYGAKST